MIDPEVARLRRLRTEALLVREIARMFESRAWAADESLLGRTACASWRIARVVSGRLRAHPYAEYQKDESALSRAGIDLRARFIALTHEHRLQALKVLETHVHALARRLDDAIALAWSSDFGEAMSRSQFEIKALGASLATETRGDAVEDRPEAARASYPSDALAGEMGVTLEGDWPYLAL